MRTYFRWLSKRRYALIASCLAIVIVFGIFTAYDAYSLNWQFTGFGPKTLWDWLALLIVPLVLALGGYLLNQTEKNETALQTYLDKMSELVLDKDGKLYDKSGNNKARAVGQARTSTILRRLDGARKAVVLLFLCETDLINKNSPVIDLRLADLKDTILHNAALRDINLEDAKLTRAELHSVDLSGANLTNADLINADLYNTDLRGANLFGTDLRYANCDSIQLSRADLTTANLTGTLLRNANLSGAIFTGAKLNNADLRNAIVENTDFRGANLDGAIISQAQLNTAITG